MKNDLGGRFWRKRLPQFPFSQWRPGWLTYVGLAVALAGPAAIAAVSWRTSPHAAPRGSIR